MGSCPGGHSKAKQSLAEVEVAVAVVRPVPHAVWTGEDWGPPVQ